MWEIAGWMALGALLMFGTVWTAGRWELCRQAREKREAGARLEAYREARERNAFERNTEARLRDLERRESLNVGNIEYLQAQNAGQGSDIEELQAWAPCIDRQIERNEGAAHQKLQGLHSRLLVLEARKV